MKRFKIKLLIRYFDNKIINPEKNINSSVSLLIKQEYFSI